MTRGSDTNRRKEGKSTCLQEEENEKLKSKEIRIVVRKLIKLIHTGLPASLGNKKLWMEKEIFGLKRKSIERNRKNEVLVQTETLKSSVKRNKSETTTPVDENENQGNYQKGRQQQGKASKRETVTGQSINYQHSGIMGNQYSLPVQKVKVEVKPEREEQIPWFDKQGSYEPCSLKRF